MSFDALCTKMGYNPMKDPFPMTIKDHEDDSQTSPFSVLSLEELEFMTDYLIAHRDEIVM